MKKLLLILCATVSLLLFPKANFGQAPDLGTASSFALFTAAGAFTNVGPTLINGDIGTNAGATDFTGITINGNIYMPGSPTATLAATAVEDAYGYMSTLGGAVLGITMGSGQTITPGIYFTGAASTIDGNLILDGEGDSDALFIIRIGGALSTGSATNIILINGASPNNVYWQVMGQFDLGLNSAFQGTVIADGAINLMLNSTLNGRGLSVAGAISLFSNTVSLGVQPDAPVVDVIQPTCTEATGTITVTSPTGVGMTYSIDASDYSNTDGIFDMLIPGDYNVTAKDADGYISPGTDVTINDQPLAPDVPLATVTQPDCTVLTGTIEVTSPLGLTLEYSIDGIIWQTSTTFSGLLADDTYTIFVHDTDDPTCTSQADFVIDPAPPIPNANAGPDREICLYSTTQIGATAVLGSTYSWTSMPVGFTSSVANPMVTPLVTTIYTLVETFPGTAVPGCSNTNSVTVTVSPAAVMDPVPNQVVCSNSMTNMVNFTSSIEGTVFNWTNNQPSIGLPAIGSGNIVPFSASNPGTTPVIATITVTPDSNGCMGLPTSFTITVNPLPAAIAGANRSVCPNTATQIGAPAVLGNTYSWTSMPSGFTSRFSNPVVNPLVTTTYTLEERNNVTGCIGTNSVTLTVIPGGIANAGPDVTICKTGTITLSESTATNFASLLWTTAGTGTFNDPSTLHPVYTPSIADAANGNVLLTLTAIGEGQCGSSSDFMLLNLNSGIVSNAGPDQNYCVLTGLSLNGNNPAPGTGLWTLVSGPNTPVILNPTLYNSGLSNMAPGIYVFKWTINDGICPPSESTVQLSLLSGECLGLLTTKKAVETTYSAVGNVIHYSIEVSNISPLNIINIAVTDLNATILSGNPVSLLTPGASATILASHMITQQDIDAGQVVNCAYASGTYTNGFVVADSSECVTVMGAQRPQITITKFAAEPTFHHVGEVIHYSFEIFNCGSVTVSNITIQDNNAVILSGNPILSLAPRQTVTATAEHIVTQADLDSGEISNIAYVNGFDPIGNSVKDESNKIVLYSNMPAKMVVALFAQESSFNSVGDTINYMIAVKNFRTTTMSNITVTGNDVVITGGNPIFRLETGKTALVYAYHIIKQQELDAGKLTVFVSARGTDYYDAIDRAISNEVTVFGQLLPVLNLTKTSDDNAFMNTGDVIYYTNQVRNNGNVRITGIVFSDANTTIEGSNRLSSLEPGQTATFRSVYSVSQMDLNIGEVKKSASVTGYDPNRKPIQATSNMLVTKGVQNAQFTAGLSAAESGYGFEGERVHYTMEIRNTGNTLITNMDISDNLGIFSNSSTTSVLAPGNVVILHGEHLVTSADLATGSIINQVSVTGYNLAGQKITRISNALSMGSNRLEKIILTQIPTETSFDKAGDEIHYVVTIRNNGNEPLSNVSLSVENGKITGNPTISFLAPSERATFMVVHKTTQSDLDAGLVNSFATLSGKYANGTAFEMNSNPAAVYALVNSSLYAEITSVHNSFEKAGQQLSYVIKVKNLGNVSLAGIQLESQSYLTITGAQIENLAPGMTMELSALYSVQAEDLEAGKIITGISATGKDPLSRQVNAFSDEVTVEGIQKPTLMTRSTALQSSFTTPGEIIHYQIVVKNTGNVSIISTAVTDPNAVILTARPNTVLLPGESFEVSAAHLVTAADIAAGKVICSAKAEGFDLVGNTITKTGNKVTVYLNSNDELSEEMTLSGRGIEASNTRFQNNSNLVKENSTNESFRLINFPNPFAYETMISFDLSEKGEVTLKIYDLTGREVGYIEQRQYNPGRNQVLWNSGNLQKGMYIIRLTQNGNQATHLMSVIY